MSTIRYRELSLSEVIEESNLVVEVEFVKAYTEEIPISQKSTTGSALETSPPFIKKGNVFKIKQVLKNTSKLTVPETIQVPDENWRRALGDHKKKHLKAPGKSYIVPEYKSTVKSASKASVFFLNYFQEMYELTARNSFEDKAALEKVSMIIEAA